MLHLLLPPYLFAPTETCLCLPGFTSILRVCMKREEEKKTGRFWKEGRAQQRHTTTRVAALEQAKGAEKLCDNQQHSGQKKALEEVALTTSCARTGNNTALAPR